MEFDLFSRAGLSMERLRAFCLVAAAGGFTRAARGDLSKQPLLSRQIKELEEFFGVELLRRVGRGVALTEPGKDLYRLVRDYFGALRDFKGRCDSAPVTLKIGAGDSVIQWVILPCLEETRKAVPNVRLELLNLPSQEIAEKIADGQIDLGVVRRDVPRRGIKSLSIGRMNFALFVARKYLRSRKSPDWKAVLNHCPLAVLEGTGIFRQTLRSAAERAAAVLRVELECSSFPALAKAVQSAGLAAILPVSAACELPESRYAMLPLPWAQQLGRDLEIIWSPRVAEIRIIISDAAEKLGGIWHGAMHGTLGESVDRVA